jgi:hypothetical protein
MVDVLDQFAEIPTLVLAPLAGRSDADWTRAPTGKWSPAQIVEHLALSIETSGARFAERSARPPVRRRSRGLVNHAAFWCVIRRGWFPSGFRAPAGARPGAAPAPRAVERRFRESHARFDMLASTLLPGRAADLFVRHPAIGDMTVEEWLRFHVVHCRHHARQVHERLA